MVSWYLKSFLCISIDVEPSSFESEHVLFPSQSRAAVCLRYKADILNDLHSIGGDGELTKEECLRLGHQAVDRAIEIYTQVKYQNHTTSKLIKYHE